MRVRERSERLRKMYGAKRDQACSQASELAEISNSVRKVDQKVDRATVLVNHSGDAGGFFVHNPLYVPRVTWGPDIACPSCHEGCAMPARPAGSPAGNPVRRPVRHKALGMAKDTLSGGPGRNVVHQD